jgi:hypothetical protein
MAAQMMTHGARVGVDAFAQPRPQRVSMTLV